MNHEAAMNDSNPADPNLAPHPRQQMAAVAELRWRLFINSLRTFHGRLKLASRIFLGIVFMAGGVAAP